MVFYLSNVIFAAAVALPLFLTLNGQIAYLTMRSEIAQHPSYAWWSGFRFHDGCLAETMRPSLNSGFGPMLDNVELLFRGNFNSFGLTILFAGLAYIFLMAFLNGGALSQFIEDRGFSMQRFLGHSGHYLRHMSAFLTLQGLVLWGIYRGISPLLFSMIDSVTVASVSAPLVWFVNLAGYILVIKLVFIVVTLFDYARIILIAEKKTSSLTALGLSVKFVFSRLQPMGLNALLAGIAILMSTIAGTIFSIIHPSGLFMVILSFLLQQVYLFLLISMRVACYSTEVLLYQQQMAENQQVKKRKH